VVHRHTGFGEPRPETKSQNIRLDHIADSANAVSKWSAKRSICEEDNRPLDGVAHMGYPVP